jgi:hypothetical protein
MEQRAHALYKGLQRPLVFKFLRGRFIYCGLGSIVAGIVSGGIASAVLSSVAGLVTLIAVSLPISIIKCRYLLISPCHENSCLPYPTDLGS